MEKKKKMVSARLSNCKLTNRNLRVRQLKGSDSFTQLKRNKESKIKKNSIRGQLYSKGLWEFWT